MAGTEVQNRDTTDSPQVVGGVLGSAWGTVTGAFDTFRTVTTARLGIDHLNKIDTALKDLHPEDDAANQLNKLLTFASIQALYEADQQHGGTIFTEPEKIYLERIIKARELLNQGIGPDVDPKNPSDRKNLQAHWFADLLFDDNITVEEIEEFITGETAKLVEISTSIGEESGQNPVPSRLSHALEVMEEYRTLLALAKPDRFSTLLAKYQSKFIAQHENATQEVLTRSKALFNEFLGDSKRQERDKIRATKQVNHTANGQLRKRLIGADLIAAGIFAADLTQVESFLESVGLSSPLEIIPTPSVAGLESLIPSNLPFDLSNAAREVMAALATKWPGEVAIALGLIPAGLLIWKQLKSMAVMRRVASLTEDKVATYDIMANVGPNLLDARFKGQDGEASPSLFHSKVASARRLSARPKGHI